MCVCVCVCVCVFVWLVGSLNNGSESSGGYAHDYSKRNVERERVHKCDKFAAVSQKAMSPIKNTNSAVNLVA